MCVRVHACDAANLIGLFNHTQATPSFPVLVDAISEAISTLGTCGVFPKLNWSAPRVRTVCLCVHVCIVAVCGCCRMPRGYLARATCAAPLRPRSSCCLKVQSSSHMTCHLCES